MEMYYEINSELELRMWKAGAENTEPPLLFQPTWPDGTPWGSMDEVVAWAEQLKIANLDEAADLPGNSPDQPTIARTPIELVPRMMTQKEVDDIVSQKIAEALAERGLA